MNGALIAIVGSSGVGKTSFAQALCQTAGFTCALEQHDQRPFQQLFAQDLTRYALANQVDYLLLRAEQESAIRRSPGVGVLDGGLDQDFFVFTCLFYAKGYLSRPEFELCQRLYRQLRSDLPPADLTVWLQAPLEVIAGRFASRQRSLQIAQIEDLKMIEKLVDEWMSESPPTSLLIVDASQSDLDYIAEISQVIAWLEENGRL